MAGIRINGILNTAVGSGLFWNPGNIAVGPNKAALLYKLHEKKVSVGEYIYQDGYNAFTKVVMHNSSVQILQSIAKILIRYSS